MTSCGSVLVLPRLSNTVVKRAVIPAKNVTYMLLRAIIHACHTVKHKKMSKAEAFKI